LTAAQPTTYWGLALLHQLRGDVAQVRSFVDALQRLGPSVFAELLSFVEWTAAGRLSWTSTPRQGCVNCGVARRA
jgi:hypothetical protein